LAEAGNPMGDFIPFANLIFAEETFEATLQHIIDFAVVGVAGCTTAGLTLLERGGPNTAAATSEVALRVDATQYKENSGPCLDAYRRQVINRINSTDTEERWPAFCRAASAAGVHSTLSFPLVVAGDGLGAINLYSDIESGFDDIDERMGSVFANHASVTLANARSYWRNEDLRRNLESALETRGVIDQAKGILMAREGMSADDAFEVLKRASQRANRKVHEIAQAMIDAAVQQDGSDQRRIVDTEPHSDLDGSGKVVITRPSA
jgi:transcriptional regulator with GAF, ATPase, and Fis domain